jgi:hypothetical protein
MVGGEESEFNQATANKKGGVSFDTIFPVYDVTAKEDNKSII